MDVRVTNEVGTTVVVQQGLAATVTVERPSTDITIQQSPLIVANIDQPAVGVLVAGGPKGDKGDTGSIGPQGSGITSINSLTGVVFLGGAQGISISPSGQTLFVSGQDWATNLNLVATGSYLYATVTGLSGSFNTQIANTGSQAWAAATNNGLNLSGNLTTTGQTLQGRIDSLSGFVGAASGGLVTRIVATGNAAVSHADGIGSIVSGNLTATGQTLFNRDTSISGGLETRIAATGAAAVAYANTVGLNLSGDLTQTGIILRALTLGGDTNLSGNMIATGQTLYAMITGMSGQGVLDYATKIQLTSTGQTLYQLASGVSGNMAQTGATLLATIFGGDINLSGNLTTTGQTLRSLTLGGDTNLSGVIGVTGSNLYVLITGLSGQSVIDYATKAQLTTTGQTLDNKINTLSGFVGGVSGALQAQIGAGGGVSSLNGLINAVTISGTGGLTVSVAGQVILVSGDQSISGALTSTGIILGGKIDSLSGFVGGVSGGLETRLTQTGTAAVVHANGIGTNLSGNLALSGSSLYVMMTGLSGQGVIDYATKVQLTTTGQTLQGRIDSLSGFVSNVSGGLEARLAATGTAAVAHANGIGSVLSGNLTQTGVALGSKIDSLSGYAESIYVHRTGSELVTGIKTFVSELRFNGGLKTPERFMGATNYSLASGDYIVVATGALPNVTGILPTITDGGYSGVLFTIINARSTSLPISGVIGPDTNPLIAPNDAIQVYGGSGVWHYIRQTGSPIWADSNNNALNLSGALSATGAALIARDSAISGGLEQRIFVTGAAAIAHANGIGTIISGNLTTTGQTLLGFVIGGDTNLSGNLTLTGQTLRALTLGGDTNLSGQLTITGQTLYQMLTGLSGQGVIDYATKVQLTTSGQTLLGFTLGGDTNLSGALATTGSNLYITMTGLSGQGVIDYATKTQLTTSGQTLLGFTIGGDTNLSGNLTQTGVTLMTKINSLSGFTIGVSGALQALIAGGGSVVKVTGSAAIATADFTGAGSVTVVSVGGQVIVSGSASSSSSTWTHVDIDFGTGKPVYEKTFNVVNGAVSSVSKIAVLPCGVTASGQQDGDWLWDGLVMAAKPGTGSFTLYALAVPGPVKGLRTVQYQIT